MDDDREDEFDDRPARPAAEGVRIIGAEEAEKALESGQAARRRPEDAPRFGDRPASPEGPRPEHRFPLPESVHPEAVPRAPVTPPPTTELPHWTEPPTGEVPKIFADVAPETATGDDDDDDFGVWSSLSRQPRWRDQASDWDETDFEDASMLAGGDETRLGALDTTRSEHSDLFSFDDEPTSTNIPVDAPPQQIRTGRRITSGGRVSPPEPPTPPLPRAHRLAATGARDVQTAVAVGLGVGIVALLAFKLGRLPTFVVALAVVVAAAVEVFDVLRRAGYQPATLLGLAGTVSIMVATYSKGETAIPMVMALMVVFTFLWYLAGVVSARPTINVGATLLGFMWVGFLGSYAALMLSAPGSAGLSILVPCVLATVASDVGGFVIGSQIGSRALFPDVSPNKTVEGLVGGILTSVVLTTLIIGILPKMTPWDAGKAALLGAVIGVVAPLGDLCQSMIKRDLGIKDTGTILPGHGGLLDRFDGMLFALPAAFYLFRVLFA